MVADIGLAIPTWRERTLGISLTQICYAHVPIPGNALLFLANSERNSGKASLDAEWRSSSDVTWPNAHILRIGVFGAGFVHGVSIVDWESFSSTGTGVSATGAGSCISARRFSRNLAR